MILIVDSWAWLATTEEGKIADKSLEYIDNEKNILFTTVLNVYEVYYRLKENSNEEEARAFIATIKNRATVVTIDEDIAILAGDIHLKEKLSSIDAFVYATAIKLDAKVITGDPHFKGKERTIFID